MTRLLVHTAILGLLATLSLRCGAPAKGPEPAPPPIAEKSDEADDAGSPAPEPAADAASVPEAGADASARGQAARSAKLATGEAAGAGAVEAALASRTVFDAATGVGLAAPHSAAQAAQVRAGAHDDNEEYPMWLDFVEQHAGPLLARQPSLVLPADYRDRAIVRIVDATGAPTMNVPFHLEDASGNAIWSGRTYASGESVVYPRALFRAGAEPITRIVVVQPAGEIRAGWQPGLDGIVTVAIAGERPSPRRLPVDIAFVVDATGSMGDEIDQLRDVLFSIHRRLQNASPQAHLRFGMIVYRDRGDAVPLQVVRFTADVDSFEVALSQVRAQGGGDGPEDLQSALVAALDSLDWNADGIRNAFVVADAPPHSDYGQPFTYLTTSAAANGRAIRLHTIGASGLPLDGECIFRQIAATTYGQFIFLTYGESGESEGAGIASDPGKVSHHTGSNWASRRLDDIVVDLVRRDMAYQVEVSLLTTDSPAPTDQPEHLHLRLANLWEQMTRQIAAYSPDTLTALLLPFENALPDSSALAEYLRDLSTEVLVRNGGVRLVERDRLDAVLREQQLSAGGLVDRSQAVELGHLLNSRLVLTGKVYRLGTDRVVHVRAIDAETAQIVAAARVRV